MLNISLIDMICIVLNLFVLYFLMKKFLFKPVNNMIERRQKEIEHNISASEDQRIKAEAMLEEYDGKLKNASHEASSVVAQAKTRAEHEYQTIIKRAQADAKRLSEETEAQLEAERQSMLTGVRKEVASLALLAASRVASHDRSYEDDSALLEDFLNEVGETS